jgi:GNAT superfamily N-acetyltransferase
MKIHIIPAYDHPQQTGILFSEYTNMLIAHDPTFQQYLLIQHYEDEIRDLESKYGLPDGRLYLVYADTALAGCIGLRKIDKQSCEMKRLYVRPQFRGQQIGDQLIKQIISDAQKIGYQFMLLDTLPFLSSALHLYQKYGFYDIPRYNDNPIDGSIYMQLDL